MPEDPIVAALLQAADALTTGDRPRADASMERIGVFARRSGTGAAT